MAIRKRSGHIPTKKASMDPMDEPERDQSLSSVATVDRALTVLTAFKRGDSNVTLAELARRTGLVKSTVMRIALSLEKFGLLIKHGDGSYQLGPETLRLGTTYQHHFKIDDFVLPVLHDLAESTLETAIFYVRSGEQRLCLFRVESSQSLRIHVRPGDLLPMDASSGARVLGMREADPGRPFRAIYTSGQRNPHVASLSAPVLGLHSELVGAITLAGPVSRFDAARAQSVSHLLEETAERLSRVLGGGLRT